MLSPSIGNSGSLVFFCGHGFISRAIALRTCSWAQLFDRQWISHVGFTIDYNGDEVLIESTTLDNLPCLIAEKQVKGVQAHRLQDRLENYVGRVFISRPVIDGMGVRFLKARAKKLRQAALSKIGEPYDGVGALITGGEFLKHWFMFNPKRFFCSELTAWALTEADMCPARKNTKFGLVTPSELALDTEYGDGWQKLKEITLEKNFYTATPTQPAGL